MSLMHVTPSYSIAIILLTTISIECVGIYKSILKSISMYVAVVTLNLGKLAEAEQSTLA